MLIARLLSAATILIVLALGASAETLPAKNMMPSEWGPDDERGAANRVTPQKVLEATQLIKEGRIYELGRDYEAGMPLFPGRHYSLTIPGSPTGGPLGANNVVRSGAGH